MLRPRGLWRRVPAAWWPRPLTAIEPAALAPPWPDLAIGCGGKSAAVLAALARRMRVVIVQHPRMALRQFDLVVAARHDELTGPNVLVTRTALHRVTPERLAAAAAAWAARLAGLPRPLVAVLVGGGNGRFRLDAAVGAQLAGQLADMMRRDRVGVVLTPSRRTDPAVRQLLRDRLEPLGAWVWDMTGENPYFGMLALADAIVVTASRCRWCPRRWRRGAGTAGRIAGPVAADRAVHPRPYRRRPGAALWGALRALAGRAGG